MTNRRSKTFFFRGFRPFSRFVDVFGGFGGIRGPESERSRKNKPGHPKNPGKALQKCRKIVLQNFPKNANCKARFSGIFIMIFRDFSDEKKCFCVNFPIPAPLVPQNPKSEKDRQMWKKVENLRKKHVLERRLDRGCQVFRLRTGPS